MCNLKTLNKSTNGVLFFCLKNRTFNLSFNNLTFNFTNKELFDFIKYIGKIDCDYWENEYQNSIYPKRIPIPTMQTNFIILLDRQEVEELQYLLDFEKKDEFLKLHQIQYNLILN
jgi:hypothetical protein